MSEKKLDKNLIIKQRQTQMEIRIKSINGGKLPKYKTDGSAGADCYARINDRLLLGPGETYTIPLGFAVEIPEGYEMQIRPRSGLASKNKINVILGTIDSDYRGEVKAIFWNCGNEAFEVKDGDRIAQAVICPVIKAEWILTDELSETERGEGGFGSTGVSELKMDYPHKVEKFYEPFKNAHELQNLLGKEVIVDRAYTGFLSRIVTNGLSVLVYFKITGAVREDVSLESIFSHEVEMNTATAFERVKIDGHRFGQEIEFE